MTPELLEIPIDLLRSLIVYDPISGLMTWKRRSSGFMGYSESTANKFNSRFAGQPACATPNGTGYLTSGILGNTYRAHRVAWALAYGEWPIADIDHINGDRQDNRLANLRVVTDAENNLNKRLSRNNKSGHIGVSWAKTKYKWVVTIGFRNTRRVLGYFSTVEEAIAVRRQAQVSRGFHPNHGRAA